MNDGGAALPAFGLGGTPDMKGRLKTLFSKGFLGGWFASLGSFRVSRARIPITMPAPARRIAADAQCSQR